MANILHLVLVQREKRVGNALENQETLESIKNERRRESIKDCTEVQNGGCSLCFWLPFLGSEFLFSIILCYVEF